MNTEAQNSNETKDENSIKRLQLGDREILLLGTAHISRESVDLVTRTIREEQPDRVCVEIDENRYQAISKKKDWSQINIYQIIREKKVFFLLGNYVLASFQKRMGIDLGVRPGTEMLEAIRTAESEHIPFSLCDRDIQVTLKRAWAKTGLWGKNKLLAALLGSIFSKEKLTEEQIEELKEKGALEGMMEELAGYLPSVKQVLIDERDRYLAAKIFDSAGDKIVAVVGAGHMPGIVRRLEALHKGNENTELSDISSVPPRGIVSKLLPWIIPAAVAAIIALGFFRSGWDGGFEMLKRWVIVNGSLSAAGAAAALAHPLTIIASFLAAPVTSMNPTIGVGFVSGILEAFFRKPTVNDFEKLQDDIGSFRGFFRNRFTRILLVFFFSSLGSAIGTFIAIPLLFPPLV
jgi:pheromone shutdown-related protein TraB